MRKVVRMMIFILFISILSAPMLVRGEDTVYEELTPKLQVIGNKEWSIKFNAALNKDTINNKNIIIIDEKGKVVPVVIKLDNDEKTIIVGSPVSGYIPGNTYYLNVTKNVQGKDGKKLDKEAKMKFTVIGSFSNGTSNENLPQIADVQFDHRPIISGETQELYLSAKTSGKVQYRVFIQDYKTGGYEEVTKGYTEPVDGTISYKYIFCKTLKAEEKAEGKKYKLLVYIKRADLDGEHKDSNTDYDNYYIDYFKCVVSVNMDNVSTVTYNNSLDDLVNIQKTPVTDEGERFMKASSNQVAYYLNPENFLDGYGKYQFMNLNGMKGITAEDLNLILKGKGVLENKGAVFLQAQEENDISAIYLVSHALLETGEGTSALAKGIEVKELKGQPVAEPKIAYNMFGIKAIDSNPNKEGSEYAYSQKWFSVDEAILGGAKFISSQYINNPKNKQNTLYEMRWDPTWKEGNKDSWGPHQYATDIGWAYKQIKNIKSILDNCKNAVINFEVPVYNKD